MKGFVMMNHRLSFSSCLVMLGMMMGSPFVEAQVSIKERVGITPNAAHSTSARTPFSTYYLPCGPLPPSSQGITRYARFSGPEGDRTSVGIGGIGGYLEPTDYHVEITGGGQYIHLKQYPEGTIGTSFDFTWGFGRDVVIMCDGQVPADSGIATVYWRVIGLPPGNEGTIEVFVVRPMYQLGVNIPFPQVDFGGNTSVYVYVQNQCDTGPVQAPESVSYTASIVRGSRFGVLVNTATNDTGVTLTGLHRNGWTGWLLKFVANRDNPDSLAECLVRAWASDTNFTAGQDTVLVNPGPVGPFVKFRVTFERDTLLHGDTVKVTAVAADSNNHQVTLPDTAHLVFSIDSVQYATFINATGDSVPSPLTGVLYGDARIGKIRLVADGVKPPIPGPKAVTVVVVGSEKTGQGSAYIWPIKVRIVFARNSLHPFRNNDNKVNPIHDDTLRPKVIDFSKVDTTLITATFTDGQGNPLSAYSFSMRAYVRNRSGGHDHTANRPTGRFVRAPGDTLINITDNTGSDGRVQYTYLCSGFGGIDSVFVRCHDPADTANVVAELKINGLQLYTQGSNDTLIGITTTHTANHYATSTAISRIRQLTDSASSASLRKLQLNDMSLINGGPFDIDTLHSWDTPHQTHREGVNLDLRVTATNGRTIGETWISRMLKALHVRYSREGNPVHYHLTF